MMARTAQRLIQGFMNPRAKNGIKGPASGGPHLCDCELPTVLGCPGAEITLELFGGQLKIAAPGHCTAIISHNGVGIGPLSLAGSGLAVEGGDLESGLGHDLESGGGSLPPI